MWKFNHDNMSIYCPDSLFQLAGNAINKLPEPMSWSWSVSNVMDWVRYELQLPQYVVIFQAQKINGKTLILLNSRTLPIMRITDFEHIKRIAKNIRHLYGLPADTVERRRCVQNVYGRYYTHLAEHFGRRPPAAKSLFDYVKSIGMVSGPLRRTSGYYRDHGSPDAGDAALITRLPHVAVVRVLNTSGPCGALRLLGPGEDDDNRNGRRRCA